MMQLRSRKRKIIFGTILVLCLLLLVPFFWARHILMGSLPQLEGTVSLPGLSGEVLIERDDRGIPTITAGNRVDASFALGFLHGQERFFQMDLMRRRASGELSELFGRLAIEADRSARLHLLKRTALKVVDSMNSSERKHLKAYMKGVNSGLAALKDVPFEYFLLRTDPRPWAEEDSVLVIHSMFMFLQDYKGREERDLGVAADILGQDLFDFFCPQGTQWDAPLSGPAFETGSLPGADVFDLRNDKTVPLEEVTIEEHSNLPGSNNWAISGGKSQHGGAILTNDMHLGLSVPNTWYYASLRWKERDKDWRVTGVTLPGFPGMVVGSNEHVAWGFTNSYGDFIDVIRLQSIAGNKQEYLTPDGPESIQNHEEVIVIKGEESETISLPWTRWGPVIGENPGGEFLVVRWTAHDDESINMGFLDLEKSETLEQAMDLANQTGIPAQNFTVVDEKGHIGWTIIGKVPNRFGFDGRTPEDWSDGTRGWDGYVEPGQMPRIVDPENGCIWTANARVVGGEALDILGDGGYDLGARSMQIRDRLLQIEAGNEADMLALQLDDRAIFLERWQKLLVRELKSYGSTTANRARAIQFVENWGARASVDSVGYRIVRAFRYEVHSILRKAIFKSCYDVKETFQAGRFGQFEGPLWNIISEQPEHFLPPKYQSWNELFQEALDKIISALTEGGQSLEEQTWGARNTAEIDHPMSSSIPKSEPFLNMKVQPLPGDSHMPRVQSTSFGASMRMAVSPGREETGIFHMPCGQSGHPMSPFYRKGHDDWATGTATPFLPGLTVYELSLKPGEQKAG